MAQTYNKMKIDIKEPVTDIITAKQNDSNSRFLDVYLYDGGVPIDLTGHEVRIYMLKADGTEVFNNGEITNATAGRCQFELTDQALGAYGKLLCEISIWYDNVQILTTPTFDIHVVKNLRTNGSIESSNEYGALVVLYQNLYESIDLMTTMVEQFGEPGEVADAASIATFWQMLEYLYGVNEAALKNASVSEVLERIGLNTDGEGSGTIFGAVNTLHKLINELYNIYHNASYRPDEYLFLDLDNATETKTVVSGEKTATATKQIGSIITVPDGCYYARLSGTLKNSNDDYAGLQLFDASTSSQIQNNDGNTTIGMQSDFQTYSVVSGDYGIDVIYPGRSLLVKLVGGSGTRYAKNVSISFYTLEKVITEELFRIGECKANIITSARIDLTQLPRLDRCEWGSIGDYANLPYILNIDGVDYLGVVDEYSTLKVNY